MIEELISRGQQLDAVHFIYEVGLVHKFRPVPLLKAFLRDARKAAASILEDANSPGKAAVLLQSLHQCIIFCLPSIILCIFAIWPHFTHAIVFPSILLFPVPLTQMQAGKGRERK